MKKLCFALIFLVTSSFAYGQNKKISILADPWCPYTCEAKSDKPGFLIDVAKAALAGSSYEVDYRIMGWARSLTEVKEGRAHAAAGATDSDKEGMKFSPTLAQSQSCFFGKPSKSWKYEGTPSLAKVSLAVVLGYTYGEPIDAYVESKKADNKAVQPAIGANPLSLNFKKIEADRVDVILEDKNVMEYFLSGQGKKGYLESKGCLEATNVYLAFGEKAPATPELLKALEAGVQKIKANGEMAKIQKTYGM